jgi:hypothetical protein
LPPVVLAAWPVAGAEERHAFTTVANWRSYGTVVHGDTVYGQKAHSLRRILDLPTRTAVPFVLALSIHDGDAADIEALDTNSWNTVDPAEVSATPDGYQAFVQRSMGELGVAKSGYVASGSGWFSDRSACYLASGLPVIAQNTGFGRRLPTGQGLFAFDGTDDVLAAVEEIGADPVRHGLAARAIAEEHLASGVVLGALLERVLS